MKKSYWITGLVLIALIVAGILIWNNQQPAPNNQIVQECSNQDGFCIYNNIPSYLKYSEPSEFYKDDGPTMIFKEGKPTGETIEEFTGDLSEYFIKVGDSKVEDYGTYKCASTNQKPLVVEYFYDLCEGMEGKTGCGHNRKTIICDDIYFIEDFTSSYGPRWYGPYSI